MENHTIAFHYFRLPKHLWEWMLSRMRQLGARSIYAPIPWGFHEFEDGKIDLKGITNPRRDVIGFVDACTALGFDLILEMTPGPLVNIGLLNQGMPGWLLQKYPDVKSGAAKGKLVPTIKLEHPTTLALVRRWFEHLSEALVEKQSPAGAIKSVQITLPNSIDYLDFDDPVARVQWPIWLRRKYLDGGIEAINAAYQPPQSYQNINQISLADNLASPVYQQDRESFIAMLYNQVQQNYTGFLEEQGWTVAKPISPPPHGFEVNPDPVEIGTKFRWAIDAPVGAEGTPRRAFWSMKRKALASLPDDNVPLSRAPSAHRVIRLSQPVSSCYRLLMTGELLKAPLDLSEGQAILVYASADAAGETDLYFPVTDANAPVSETIGDYLLSLLSAQKFALLRVAQLADQLAEALTIQNITPPAPPSSPLSEAEQGLTTANEALRKAAASIGALEEAFATVLRKPEPVVDGPLLAADSSQFGPVKSACEVVAAGILAAIPEDSQDAVTPEEYQAAYNQIIKSATAASQTLNQTLEWLRQGLYTESLPISARTIHNFIEVMLQSLAKGVLRS